MRRYPKPGDSFTWGYPPRRKFSMSRAAWGALTLLALVLFSVWPTKSQEQQSGGGGSSVTINAAIPAGTNVIGKVGIDQTTPGTTNLVSIGTNGTVGINAALPAGANIVGKFGIDQTTPGTTNLVSIGSNGTVGINAALPAGANSIGTVVNGAGVANMGIVRAAPSACTQSTNFTSGTVGVATSAGTSVTSTTTCVTLIYANNITNSPVTLRVQDKTGTPIIWIGGNADFTIPANSNVSFPMGGVLFTSGITAIAGTASAINLQVNGLQ
jgi:hypothetical protein